MDPLIVDINVSIREIVPKPQKQPENKQNHKTDTFLMIYWQHLSHSNLSSTLNLDHTEKKGPVPTNRGFGLLETNFWEYHICNICVIKCLFLKKGMGTPTK